MQISEDFLTIVLHHISHRKHQQTKYLIKYLFKSKLILKLTFLNYKISILKC
jgi:hypothetical protein